MDLPDLKAKVKIDDSGILTTEAKLKAFASTVKSELDRTDVEGFGKRTSASLDEVEKKLAPTGQAFIRFGREGEIASLRISSSTAKTKDEIGNLETRVRSFANTMERDMRKSATAVISLGEDGSAALGKVTSQLQDTQKAASSGASVFAQFGAVLGGIASAAIPILIAAVVALTVALVPLILAVAGAVVVLTAFAAGWSAVILSLAFVLAPLAAVAAGIVMLAEKTGHVATPMQRLQDHAKAMADALGKQAAPMAEKLINALDKALPKIQAMGEGILHWFGERMPQAMSIGEQAAGLFAITFDRLGRLFGDFVTKFVTSNDFNRFWPLFGLSLDAVIRAADGLMQNLLRLSDWFTTRMPSMGSISDQVLGILGETVLWVGRIVGQWVDWFIANWPKITKAASDEWDVIRPIFNKLGEAIGKTFGWIIDHWPEIKASITSVFVAIKEGWDLVQPVFKTLRETFEALQPAIKFLQDHANELRPILIGLGIAAGMAVVGFASLGLMIGAVVIGLEVVFLAIGKVVRLIVDSWDPAMKYSGDNMSRWGSIAHEVVEGVGAVFSWLGSVVSGTLGGIGSAMSGLGATVRHITGEIDDNFSAMGGNVGGVLRSIGDRMSQLGSTVNAVVGDIGGAFSSLGSTVSSVLSAIGSMLSSLGDLAQGAVNGFVAAFGRAVAAVQGLINKLGEVAGAVGNALASIPGVSGGITAVGAAINAIPHASGGPVVPGSVYTVGEAGPETLIMGATGGYVIPNGGGGGGGAGATVNIYGGLFGSADIARALAREVMREAHWESLSKGG